MEKFKQMITLIFKAVSLAMGIAVVAMIIMNIIAINNAVLLLGIGLACAGIERLIKAEKTTEE
ncbi:MAG: hypothetical protein IJ298_09205 [Ruminococcus sp.]|nr:hypothetical protein [Ruminococcus sp.]